MAHKEQKAINKDKKISIYLGNKILLRSGLTFDVGTEPEAEENATTPPPPPPTARSPRPHAPVGTARAALRGSYHAGALRL